MKFPSFKKKLTETKQNPAWVFDFGTSSVKILLCNYLQERVEVLDGTKIKYNAENFDPDDNFRPENLESSIREQIKILQEKNNFNKVRVAVVGLGGLTVEGYTSKINYRRVDSEKPVTENEFKNILKRVEDRSDQIMRKMISWETADNDDIVLISSEVIDIALGGYSVASPVGSAGEKLSFVVYNSYTKDKNLKSIIGLMKTLDLRVVNTVAVSYAVLRAVLENQTEGESAVVLDIGAKTSEVGAIDNNRIIGHLGLDLAGNSFTKNLADAIGKNLADAEKIKLAFAAAKLSGELMKEVREKIATDCKVFVSGVELVLKEFPGLSGLPEKVYLVGGGSLLPGIQSCLQSCAWGESGSLESWIHAEPLLPKHLKGFADLTGALNSPADVPVLAVALDSFDLLTE